MPETATLTEPVATTVLGEACVLVGLDASGAELIRLGDNAVFVLRGGDVIARVSRSRDRLPSAERQVQVSRWLAASSVPAIRALNVAQPVVASDLPVTFWESAGEANAYGSTADLASLLRMLHGLPIPEQPSLPPLDPFQRAQARLNVVEIAATDRLTLSARGEQLADAFAHLPWRLSRCVLHGDANVGNTIRSSNGRVVLSDLDGFCVGPAEWDLVLTAMFWKRYGWHTGGEYRAFVEGYGYDVTEWDGFDVLSEIREFLMVTWLAQKVADPQAGAEFAKRMAALRSGGSRRDWLPL